MADGLPVPRDERSTYPEGRTSERCYLAGVRLSVVFVVPLCLGAGKTRGKEGQRSEEAKTTNHGGWLRSQVDFISIPHDCRFHVTST